MKKNNNKGFTLIEILVAIVALALVIVPLLQGFVATANLNRKSRERMMATNVAQTHMEQYSGYTIEEIDKIINKDLYVADPDLVFTESVDHKYSYPIKNYNHNGKNYDIRLSIDASNYYNSRVNQAGDTVDGVNNIGFAEVTSVDVTQDGIYAESENVLQDALNEFESRNRSASSPTVTNRSVPAESFRTRLDRDIAIDVQQYTDAVGAYVEVKVQYTYTYSGAEEWLDADDKEYTKSIIIFSNQSETTLEKRKLRNVYLLFRPYYGTVYGDYIVVNNESNLKFNVYMVKLDTMNDKVQLETAENNYFASVHLKELTNTLTPHVKIYTNLGYNIAKEDDVSTSWDEREVPTQVKYYYWSTPSTWNEGIIETDYFVPEYKGERMYRMKVEVYNAGAADNGFLDSEKLAELSN